MKEQTLHLIADILVVAAAAVVVAAAAAVVVVAAAAVVVVAAAAVVVLVLVVVAAAAAVVVLVAVESPKLSICISSFVIILSIISLFYTLPNALNPPQTVEVVCQTVRNSTQIFIHQSTTQTITMHSITNQTYTQSINQVHCP